MNYPRRIEIDEEARVVRLLSLKPRGVTENVVMTYDKAARRKGGEVAGLKVFLVKDGKRTTLWASETLGETGEDDELDIPASQEEGK